MFDLDNLENLDGAKWLKIFIDVNRIYGWFGGATVFIYNNNLDNNEVLTINLQNCKNSREELEYVQTQIETYEDEISAQESRY